MLKGSDESFGFWRPRASKSLKCDAEFLFGIAPEILLDEGWSKTVKASGYRRVGCEKISRSCDRQRDFEGLPGLFHEVPGALQNSKRSVAFIQMTDLWLKAKCAKQPPSANPEQQFLLEAQFRPAAVEFAGNSPMSGKVCRVIAVQQIKLHSADLNLPGAQPDRVAGQSNLQAQPLSVRLA